MNNKIGIITGDTSLFSNGLIQNAYFLHNVYTNIGYKCDLLCWNSKHIKLDYKDVLIKTISEDETIFNIKHYKLLITVSTGITTVMYNRCKKYNVRIVGFLCGNSMFTDMENWIVSKPNVSVISKERPVDDIWLLGAFQCMKQYIELLRGAKAQLVPHLWSPCLIEDQIVTKIKKQVHALVYDPLKIRGKKIDIVILEPNLHIVKTSLIPIMAAEKFNIDTTNSLNQVFVFNFPIHSKDATHIVNNLTIKDKMRKFKSLHIAEILAYFNEKDTVPIFVSHQIYNAWNYLYYELMYYGYPLIHNSNLLKDYCYYYDEFDIATCADKIKEAALHHNENFTKQLEMNRTYLKSIDPAEEESMTVWKTLAESVA